jgi:hypothetical protein
MTSRDDLSIVGVVQLLNDLRKGMWNQILLHTRMTDCEDELRGCGGEV